MLKRSARLAIGGLAGSADSLCLAALAAAYPRQLIVVPTSAQAEALKAELALWTGRAPRLFPAPDTLPAEEFPPARELIGERLSVIKEWGAGDEGLVIAPVKALMWRTSRGLETIRLSADQNIRIDRLIEQLIEFGYKRFEIVGERGEFSVRGGIVDIFPLDLERPVRLEFDGDRLASLRRFESYSQRSLEKLELVELLPARENFAVPVLEHLPKECLIVFAEPLEIGRAADRHLEEERSFPGPNQYLTLAELESSAGERPRIDLARFLAPGEEPFCQGAPSFQYRLADIPREALVVSKHAARLEEELGRPVQAGSLRGGFILGGVTVLTDRELFGEETRFRQARPAPAEGVADELLADLKPGDHVVHEYYGIALYRGLQKMELDGLKQEYLLLEFAEGDQVYVPPAQAGLIEKYSGGGDLKPRLSRLGTKQWLRTRAGVKRALKEMTEELLQLYAARQKLPGFAFPPDDLWQAELAGTFPYEATPDQQRAIEETNREMEVDRPMDRLVCGDVGYGKTEVALRAAAKAVAAGKQVAVLVPTTILAEQHFNNFRERFRSTPFVVEMLSRFRSRPEQKVVVRSLAQGGVDILIGTHRLLSRDVKFKDLGLLVIDEEQRFGVAHKEKIKKLKLSVDVLTLSATPIPRTLYLALSGARNLSVINTPPVDRSPIRTHVLPWSEAVLKEAIRRELDRGGQVYLVHNFVETIEGMAVRVKRLVPEARVAVGHGQLPEEELERTMLEFMDRKYDVLVCTSIIESGLDIPNVNTILIDQADRFGLSQLYQIRGRVGRSSVRAYAYLFYHPARVMTDQALERLQAIQEFTALGSGYKLAMRDLEIRGAGNLLGAQQSGHIMEVGFDLYCELLEEAVKEVKGITEPSPREVTIDLKVEAHIPENYVTDDRQRIALYRRMNLLSQPQELEELKKELRDRFGRPPAGLEKLFRLLELKVQALQRGIRSIREQDGQIVIERANGKRVKLAVSGEDKIKLAERGIG